MCTFTQVQFPKKVTKTVERSSFIRQVLFQLKTNFLKMCWKMVPDHVTEKYCWQRLLTGTGDPSGLEHPSMSN